MFRCLKIVLQTGSKRRPGRRPPGGREYYRFDPLLGLSLLTARWRARPGAAVGAQSQFPPGQWVDGSRETSRVFALFASLPRNKSKFEWQVESKILFHRLVR